MDGVAEQIAAVVAARRGRLPRVQAEIGRWHRVDTAAAALARAIAGLCGYPGTPREVTDHLAAVRVCEERPSITRVIEWLQRVESRMARPTVCIGVAGSARAGQSTLLRSISGLTDAWLPTGSTGPATAVTVRLSHTSGRSRAVLDLHTFDTFRTAHLRPAHLKAGLDEPPVDLEAFRTTDYPESSEPRELQKALRSYESLLDRPGGKLELIGDELERLREYVTRPVHGATEPVRSYLAVRQARIECPYPNADAAAISVVDLPGLDATDEARRRLTGLRHELDLVLLVKRTAGRSACWTCADEATLALLDDVRGFVRRRGDFVIVVLNIDRPGRGVRWTGAGAPLRVLRVDARDPAEVSERLLRPVLSHIAARLSIMDEEVFAGIRTLTGSVRDELVRLAVATKAVLRQVPVLSAGDAADVYRRADELHANLAATLDGLLGKLRERAGRHDPDFVAAVDRVHEEFVGWARDGLGMGYDRWRAEAVRAARRDGGTSTLAAAELGRVRREIGHRYATHLDRLLQHRTEQVWVDVAAAISDTTGALLRGRSGYRALALLGTLATDAAQPCAALASAVGELLAVRMEYHTHLHARIGPYLRSLHLAAGQPGTPVSVDRLYRRLCTVATRTADRVHGRLRDEAAFPGQILYAAVERFADTVVHSGVAEQEIRQLARSYRAELWGAADLTDADVRVVRAARAVDDLLAATTDGDGQCP